MKRVKDMKLPILLALSLFAVDSALTMAGQQPYEERVTGNVKEANPVFRFAMHNGWLIHIPITALWVLGITLSISISPRVIGLAVSFAWSVGHSMGALTWLLWHFGIGFWIVYVFCFVVGLAMAFTAKAPLTPPSD